MTAAAEPRTIDRLIRELPELAREAEARASEIEGLRKLPQDFAQKLLHAGIARILLPGRFGGLDGTYLEWWRIILALSKADGSTGWVSGQSSMYSAVIAAKHPADSVQRIFEDPLANVAGSGVGRGRVTPVVGGYLVTGRWKFGSACTLATYFAGMATVSDDPSDFGAMMLCPLSEGTIHETWDSVSLAGSGSHEVEFNEVFVPSAHVHWPFDHKTELGGPVGALAAGHWWDTCVTAVVEVGIARHVLEEVWKVARVKPLGLLPGSPMRTSDSAILRTLQTCEGLLFAQEAAMEKALSIAWDQANADGLTKEHRIDLQTAGVTAVQESKRAIDMAFEVAGTEGLMSSHVLSRLIRDAQAMPMHVVGRKTRFELLGRFREGDEKLGQFL